MLAHKKGWQFNMRNNDTGEMKVAVYMRIGIAKRALLYCRVDSPTHDYFALTSQENTLVAFSEKEAYNVVGKISETISGLDMERQSLKIILEKAINKDFDVLVIRDISRLGRNPYEMIAYVRELQKCGVEVVTLIDENVSFHIGLYENISKLAKIW